MIQIKPAAPAAPQNDQMRNYSKAALRQWVSTDDARATLSALLVLCACGPAFSPPPPGLPPPRRPPPAEPLQPVGWDAELKLPTLEDLDPSVRGDLLGDLELLDSETGEAVLVSASDAILSGYRVAAQAWVADVRARCRSIGGAYVLLTPADDLERVLLGGWRQAGVVR